MKYGTDKADATAAGVAWPRSAFTDENLSAPDPDPALPVVALRVPKVGELSRKSAKTVASL